MDDPATRLDTLVIRAQAGDRSAFREVVLTVHDDLRAWVSWRAVTADMVEDVVQETLIAAYRSLGDYRARGTFRAWLRGIAHHRCLMALRERRRQLARERTGFAAGFLDQALETIDEEHDEDDTPQRHLQALQHCLHELPGHARQLIEARYWRGEPLSSLVERLGKPKGTIAAMLHRIRKRLLVCIRAQEPTT
ncbi:MAG: RNA polymerase sigma factor [Planctomycetota bacterium]